ncbi:hypothetical protein J3R83DRAFT_58 [Lanmaoa asiatica]|nr:hypothetical protein J3R83DRAFT_58 [Lanmaoa asiatica]
MCLQHRSLPVELQWEIALWLKDAPDFHSRYALVSKNFYNWSVKFGMFWRHVSLTIHRLLPYLYPRVRLTETDMAAKFVDFMLVRGRPRNVQEVYIGQLVNPVQAVDVISQCCNIAMLTIRFPSWPTPLDHASYDLLLQPLENLHNLRSLSISLVMLTDGTEVDLSEFQVFHQLTHLHLIAPAASREIVPKGLSRLPSLTHLSLHWFQSRDCIACLRRFLAHPSSLSRILVLWVPDISLPKKPERKLVDRNLVDRRVVLLVQERYNEYMRKGGFWQYAERLVAWRVEKNSKWNSPGVECRANSTLLADPFATNIWIEILVWDRLLRGSAKKTI